MGSRRVYHYSHDPKLETIDPAHYGKNKSISPEYKQGTEHLAPRSYVYDSPDRHEGVVTRGRTKHEAYLPNDWHIYDIGQDSDNIISSLQAKTGLVGSGLYDALEHELKARGIHGYKNSNSPLNNVVALFHPLKVHKAASHPHSYDWHDHDDPMAKAGDNHPHLQAHGPKVETNDQAGGNLQATLGSHLPKFGTIVPSKKTNLNFYPHINEHEPKIDEHIKNSGSQVYYAGGKYGKPDLANKNYTTGHLMIYSPEEGLGGDFGKEAVTRSWRKVHEQAHRDTLPEINKIYGEGRRLGRLGVRTPNEMRRALHWEDKTVHRQRQIMASLGHHISDTDFNKERNTVLTDALNRALSGKFSDPSDEGFEPHSHHVDLRDYMNVLDEKVKELGLRHDHDTLAELKAGKA